MIFLQCQDCKVKFSTKGNLKAHQNLKHGHATPIQCKSCQKVFTVKRNLVVHMRKHHIGGLNTMSGSKKIKNKIEKLIQGIDSIACVICVH